jgi:hypothetical protein
MDDYIALVWAAEREAQDDEPVRRLERVTCENGVYGWFVIEGNRG